MKGGLNKHSDNIKIVSIKRREEIAKYTIVEAYVCVTYHDRKASLLELKIRI